MEAISYIVPSQFAYLSIPTSNLRNFVDGLFPSLAKCGIADAVSGKYHRYMAGHDILLDVFSTAKSSGIKDALHQAGHIALTDFPTKAGIPIPLFSNSGLGGWLVNSVGIGRGWLCVNVCDAGVGILAVADGSGKLLAALNGELPMTAWTFFDTFVQGTLEVTFGSFMKNPLLVLGGVENIFAGTISAVNKAMGIWREYSVPISVDPLSFLGAGLLSASLGFLIGYTLLGETVPDSLMEGIKSGAVGSLFTISAGCGFGAILGLAAFSFGKALAQGGTSAKITISQDSLVVLLWEITQANPDIKKIINMAKTSLFTCCSTDLYHTDILSGLFTDEGERFCLQEDMVGSFFKVAFEERLLPHSKETYLLEDPVRNTFSPDMVKLIYTQ